MRIGLLDVDSSNFPNIALMKISAWHKSQGHDVEMYDAFKGIIEPYDIVYCSKVFSFTPDYEHPIYANRIEKGGSGYCIKLVDGHEVYDKSKDIELPHEIEHIMPDYSLYPELTGWGKPLKEQFCFGFLTRGCPRNCDFCHVGAKEGRCSIKVADLSEFWSGQKNVVLCDPNILACRDWKNLLQQLIDSKAWVDFNQGLDIRLMTDEKAEMISQIRIKQIHFAWDRYGDKEIIQPKLELFRKYTRLDAHKLIVFVLCGDKSREVLPEDLERIYWLRDHGYWPYVMLYDKEHIPTGHELRKLQRWVNNRFVFAKCKRFEEYQEKEKEHD